MQSANGWEWRQCYRLLSRGGHGLSTAKSPARGESPCARDPITLAPSITAWRVAYRELAKDLQSSADRGRGIGRGGGRHIGDVSAQTWPDAVNLVFWCCMSCGKMKSQR